MAQVLPFFRFRVVKSMQLRCELSITKKPIALHLHEPLLWERTHELLASIWFAWCHDACGWTLEHEDYLCLWWDQCLNGSSTTPKSVSRPRLPTMTVTIPPQRLCPSFSSDLPLSIWRFSPSLEVVFASKLAICPVKRSALGVWEGHVQARKGQMVNMGFTQPAEMPRQHLKQGKTQRDHNWPHHRNLSRIEQRTAIKQGKKRQKDKWFHFHATTAPPPLTLPAHNHPLLEEEEFQRSQPRMSLDMRLYSLCNSGHLSGNGFRARSPKSTLKTLTSLNKEDRPFSLSDIAFGVFPLFLPLAITAFGGTEGYFSLAIIAFGAFQFIVPKYYYRLGKMESKESSLLI